MHSENRLTYAFEKLEEKEMTSHPSVEN